MKTLLKSILIVGTFICCQSTPNESNQKLSSQKLEITYSGDADVVQFRMFEGIQQLLAKDSIDGTFKGIIDIPNLSEAIFIYDIIVHIKDVTGKYVLQGPQSQMLKLNQKVAVEEKDRFLWIGENRNIEFIKNNVLKGILQTTAVTSHALKEEREITVYTPERVTSDTPHIYFTDGSTVENYAPYVDRLISTGKIIPVKLIGIHSSYSNRYKEYVRGGDDNELFVNHEQFVYAEVIPKIEKEIENWDGKRYFYGYSNGAAFCMHAGINHPTVFDEIIAFSTVDYISAFAQKINPIKFKYNEYPTFYMGAGRYETSIFNENIKFLKTMKDNSLDVEFKEFISGHDYFVWRIEFLEYIEKRFKK